MLGTKGPLIIVFVHGLNTGDQIAVLVLGNKGLHGRIFLTVAYTFFFGVLRHSSFRPDEILRIWLCCSIGKACENAHLLCYRNPAQLLVRIYIGLYGNNIHRHAFFLIAKIAFE